VADPLWFAGVCDQVLAKVQWWAANWARGEEYATRPFMNEKFEQVNVVTKRRAKIAWTKQEFQHLVRILETIRPDWPMTHDLRQAFQTQ
jgi:hypothetical protein